MPPVAPSHPRTRPAAKRVGVGCVLAALLAGLGLGLLVLAVGVGAFFLLRGERGSRLKSALGAPAAALGVNPQVNDANVRQLWKGMTPDQAQAVLGPGKPCTYNDIIAIHENAAPGFPRGIRFPGGSLNGETWYRWQNGGRHVFASFLPSKTGVLRLSSLQVFTAHPGGALESGHLIPSHPDDNLDHWAAEHDRRVAIVNNPRWKKGPAIRRALVGRWRERHNPPPGWDFNADGSCATHHMAFGDRVCRGTYRFTDDDHIEVFLVGEDPFHPDQVRRIPDRFLVLVGEKELVLCREGQGGPRPEAPFFRQP
jgi:hypothetical protein